MFTYLPISGPRIHRTQSALLSLTWLWVPWVRCCHIFREMFARQSHDRSLCSRWASGNSLSWRVRATHAALLGICCSVPESRKRNLLQKKWKGNTFFYIILPPTQCYSYKRWFKMARKPKETTRLMQRGLSHLNTTNTIEVCLVWSSGWV